MYHHIPQFKIDRVKELLKISPQLREIATQTGLSFYTVRTIYCKENGIVFNKAKEQRGGFWDDNGMCPIAGHSVDRRADKRQTKRA